TTTSTFGASRRFEIGRSRAYDLSITSPEERNRAATRPTEMPSTVQPIRDDYAVRSHSWRAEIMALLLLGLVLAAAWTLGVRPEKPSFRGLLSSTPFSIIVIGAIVIVALAKLPTMDGDRGEPLAFVGGVSVWPTEAVRFVAGALAIFF